MSTLAFAGLRETEPAVSALAADACLGLLHAGQKTLPCKYLYDDVGTLLFEAICELPEYGLTAADERLLRAHASAIAATFAPGTAIVELGSGSARKTRWVLEAMARRQGRVDYFPIEISSLAIARCRARLADVHGVSVHPLPHEYLAGLDAVPRPGAVLVLFLGSTLGNFAPAEAANFLGEVRRRLRPGDGLLVGVDLVKPAAQLRLAYDDAAGVTAAFNLNLLARLNRELGANFDLRQWQHRIRYCHRQRRVEMHLRSRREQRVQLRAQPGPGQTAEFARGETIWTESSHKFRSGDIREMLAEAGFSLAFQWTDRAWPFTECLCLIN